jgi:hypothetical protein
MELLFLIVGGFVGWACIHRVVGPLNQAAKCQQLAVQFGLADLLCLFVLVQLVVGAVHWLISHFGWRPVATLVTDVILMVVTALLWLACVRLLSQAGISRVWHRCVVLAVVLPGTIAGSIAVPGFLLASFGFLMDRELSHAGFSLFGGALVAGVIFGLGRFTRAVVAAADEDFGATEPQETNTRRGRDGPALPIDVKDEGPR